MSTTVDNKVVDMQFNNKQFETGIATSVNSLEKLKGTIGGLSGSTLAPILSGIEGMTSRFTTLGIMGVEVLQRIANKAIDVGVSVVKSLSIDQVMAGFAEYELKMGSVQTIMSGSGENLKTVNRYLEELNEYADRTIYSFRDMTSNIGKFTNAGVSLKDSVAAIQGVSNVAAISGANANEASRAMYNFAQALSSGFVKLIDWKSIENANMATVSFKEQLLQSAEAAGTVKKQANGMYKVLTTNALGKSGGPINATKNFNDSLQYQWMTTEVLTETLAKYSDETTDLGKKAFAAAQDVKTFSQLMDTLKEAAGSGWAQTFEILVGDFKEAKKLWTDVNNTVGTWLNDSADARNNLLEGWDDLGGRKALIKGLSNAFTALMDVLRPIGLAFRDIFPAMTSERLANLTKGFRNFTKEIKPSEEVIENIRRTFSGLFSIIALGVDGIKWVASQFSGLGEVLDPIAYDFLELTAKIGDFFFYLRENGELGAKFIELFEKMSDKIGRARSVISDSLTRISDSLTIFGSIDLNPLDNFSNKAANAIEPFDRLGSGFLKIGQGIKKVWDVLKPILEPLGKALWDTVKTIALAFGEALADGNLQAFADLFVSGSVGVMIYKMGNFIESISNFGDGIKSSLSGTKAILWETKDSLEVWQKSLNAKTLLTIASAIGVLSVSLVVLSGIDPGKLETAISAITILFIELAASVKAMSAGFGGRGLLTLAPTIVAISIAVAILAGAIKSMAKLSMEEIAQGVLGISVVLKILSKALKDITFNSKGLVKGATGILILSGALLVLGEAVKKFGKMNFEEMMQGLLGVSAALLSLSMFVKAVGGSNKLISIGTGLTILSAGVLILSKSVAFFGKMDREELIQGILAVGAVLLELVAFTKLAGGTKNLVSMGAGMTILGASLIIFSNAVSNFGAMSWEDLGKGLLGMAGALLIISGAFRVLPKNMAAQALAMTVVASALVILAEALSKMGGMSIKQIGSAMLTLGGSLAIIAVAMKAMSGALPGAAALIVISGALAILAPVLLMFGSMSLETIGKSLLMLVGVFAVFGVATLALSPIIPVMTTLSFTMIAFGAAVALLGAGALALGTGLTILMGAFKTFGNTVFFVLEGLIGLLPSLGKNLGLFIIEVIKTLGEGGKQIIKALGKILVEFLKLLADVIPELVVTIGKIMAALIKETVRFIPIVADAVLDFIIVILKTLADHMPDIVKQGVRVVKEFVIGLGKGIGGILDAAAKMVIAFINGVADALRNNSKELAAAFWNLASSVFQAFMDFFNVEAIWGNIKDIGRAIVNGMIDGIKDAWGAIKKGAKWLGDSIVGGVKDVLGIHSPSKVFHIIGDQIGQGLANGIRESSKKALKETTNMAKQITNAAKKGVDGFEKWAANKKAFDLLSLRQELAGWLLVQKKYTDVIEKSEVNLSKGKGSKKKNAEAQAKADKENLKKITEARKKADQEVYRLYKEIESAKYNTAMERIENQKYYNKMTLSEELLAIKKIQKSQKKGTDGYKQTKKEVYRLQNEIAEARKQYNADVEAIGIDLNDSILQLEQERAQGEYDIQENLYNDILELETAYEEAVASRAESIRTYYGLFDKVEKKRDVKSSSLVKNLEGQVESIKGYLDQLDLLSNRTVIPAELLAELKSMGQGAEKEIQAINKMSDQELTKYVSLWQEKSKLANDQSVKEFAQLRTDVDTEIKALQDEATVQLGELNTTFNTQFAEINKAAGIQLAALAETFSGQVGSMSEKSLKQLDKLAKDGKKKFKKSEWKSVSEDMMKGMMNGVDEFGPEVIEKFGKLAKDALSAAKTELGIASPSKEFFKIGRFIDQGLIFGIDDWKNKVGQSSMSLGKTVTNEFSTALSANGIESSDPIIRPVLDLTNIRSGATEIDSLLTSHVASLSSLPVGQNGSTTDQMLERVSLQLTEANGKVVNAVDRLSGRFVEFRDEFRDLRLVMDTGQVVGAIAPTMDSELGRFATMGRRRVQ